MGSRRLVDGIWRHLRPLLEAKLKEVGHAFDGQAHEIDDVTDDEYALELYLDEPKLLVRAALAEARNREWMGGPGLAVDVYCTTESGALIAEYAPGNFSDRLWTCSSRELRARVSGLEPPRLHSTQIGRAHV